MDSRLFAVTLVPVLKSSKSFPMKPSEPDDLEFSLILLTTSLDNLSWLAVTISLSWAGVMMDSRLCAVTLVPVPKFSKSFPVDPSEPDDLGFSLISLSIFLPSSHFCILPSWFTSKLL